MGIVAHFVEILEMTADDSALEDAQTVHGFKVGADPMAGISARADTFVAVFDNGEKVIGVPHAVTRIIGFPGMIVKACGTPITFSPLSKTATNVSAPDPQ